MRVKICQAAFVVLCVTCVTMFSFCFAEEDAHDLHQFESKHYKLFTRLSKAEAAPVLQTANMIHEFYLKFFSQKNVKTIPIGLYENHSEYQIAENMGESTLGHYRSNFTFSNEEIKMALNYPDFRSWREVLVHEIAHQFINSAYSLDVAENMGFGRFLGKTKKLPAVSQWLHEGIATYMEPCYANGRMTHGGKINRSRLESLQYQIRAGLPVIPNLFRNSLLGSMGGDDYPASWGIVFWMMHDQNKQKERKRRRLLLHFLNECKKGFPHGESKWKTDFIKKCLVLGKAYQIRAAVKVWRPVMEIAAKEEFEFWIKTSGYGTIEEWTTRWQEWILKLDLNDPYGGLLVKFERTVLLTVSSDLVRLKDGKNIYCSIIGISKRGILALVNDKQEFIKASEIESYAKNVQKTASSPSLYGIDDSKAILEISGPTTSGKTVGLRDVKKGDKLPDTTRR